jgi:hypothetical protein|tara:strand:+ start:289 stop:546 length:258 start_codon:yes stop_codon:yes gene_type:complete
MSYQNRMREMQMLNEAKQVQAFDKAIVDLISENEMLKRQLNLINTTNQKEAKKEEGRNQQPTNRQKVKNKQTPKRKGGCLNMKKL